MAPLALVEVVEVGAAELTMAVAAAKPESLNGWFHKNLKEGRERRQSVTTLPGELISYHGWAGYEESALAKNLVYLPVGSP